MKTLEFSKLSYSKTLKLFVSCVVTHCHFLHCRAECVVYNTCSEPTSDTLIALTPEVNSTLPPEAITHLAVKLIFSNGQSLVTNIYFDYLPNPVITGVMPTTHIIR